MVLKLRMGTVGGRGGGENGERAAQGAAALPVTLYFSPKKARLEATTPTVNNS